MSSAARGIRFVLLAQLLFAVQDGISLHLAAHYPVPFFVTVRYWLFLLFVLAVSARRPGGLRAAARTKMPVIQTIRGVLLGVQIIVIVTAFNRLGLAAAHAVFALHPLLATLLAVPVLGERIGVHRIAAVGVGFLGMLVILRPGAAVFDADALLAILAAGMFAFYAVLTRMVGRADGNSGPAFLYTGVGGAAVLSLIGPFYWAHPTAADWGWIVALSAIGMAGHYLLIRAYEAAEAVRVQPFVYIQPLLAMVIGPAIFGEPLDPWVWVGAGMIASAGLYALWRERVRAATAPSSAEPSAKPPDPPPGTPPQGPR